MCGIGGIIGKRSKNIAKKINQKLKHRGPDSSDYWISEENEYPITICHTRLSIFDLSNSGKQPFFSKDKRFVLSYNGEIYNFLELREELENNGCIFHTKTDTEVLLQGLIKDGPSFQLKCNGMWAFFLWDRKLKEGIIGRDRFGVKPLYYSFLNQHSLIFGSEMKAITPFLDSIAPSKHINVFIQNMFNYESTEECVINGIKRLRPGHYLSFKNGKVNILRYWNTLDYLVFKNVSYCDQVEEWRNLFLDSVRIRMRSDVAIGSALSGGLDSSSIVSAMSHISRLNSGSRVSKDWQHVFCSSFPGSENDETKWAKKVADNLSIPFNQIIFNSKSLSYSLEDTIAMVEDPYLTIPQPMLNTYKEVKASGVNVTLDGHGADELFSGYGHIRNAITNTYNIKKIRELIAIEQSTLTGVYSEKEKKIKRKWVKYKIKSILKSFNNRGYNFLSKCSRELFPSHKLSPIKNDRDIEDHPAFLEMDSFSQVLFEIFHCSVLPTLLRNYDRYSMANGVEIRMPFMDWRLVCHTFSLPMESKLGGGYTKRIQRDAMKNLLVDTVRLRRDKIGWNAPAEDWFRNEFKNEIENLLRENKSSLYFNSSKEAWINFNLIKNPSYIDGLNIWKALLPLVWTSSVEKNYIWR